MSKKLAALPFLVVAVVVLFIFLRSRNTNIESSNKIVRVLSYSSFLAEWGPASELAQRFEKQTGFKVEYVDADDAGLLLAKLDLFPADVVVGFDWLTAPEARKNRGWKMHGVQSRPGFGDEHFLAFDWAPLTFIFREGEIKPPKDLNDLLDSRFANQISLQDPRTSAPGLQFYFWLIAEKGEQGALEFYKKLKPNLRAVSPSWSSAYGLFQKGQAKIVFSYLTSPVYHWINEKDFKFQPAKLEGKHIYQVELAAVPESCSNCEAGIEFLKFLQSPEAQRLIMLKNVMLPVDDSVRVGTEFEKLTIPELIDLKTLQPSIERKKELLENWRSLNL